MRKTFRAVIVLLLVSSLFAMEAWGNNIYRELGKRLGRSRQDYPQLSDQDFANFREVRTTGIKPGILYRSSSPIKTWGSRNYIADNLSRQAGIKTFINLADNVKDMKACKGYPGSYYSTQKVICLNLSTKFQSKAFCDNLARGIKLMSAPEIEGPFLIHCDLGKDRAGFVTALIECLTGASLDEVVGDYMLSFWNYFGIMPGTEDYEFIADCEIRKFLAQAFGVKPHELGSIKLADGSERFFRSIGVTVNEIENLREKISLPK